MRWLVVRMCSMLIGLLLAPQGPAAPDPRELSVAVFAPAVIGLIAVGLASLFRIGRSRPLRARVLLGTMSLLLLAECGHRALVGLVAPA